MAEWERILQKMELGVAISLDFSSWNTLEKVYWLERKDRYFLLTITDSVRPLPNVHKADFSKSKHSN